MGVVNKRKHTSQFKFDVAIKAVESKHVAEVARLYGLNTGQVSKWVSYCQSLSLVYRWLGLIKKLFVNSNGGTLPILVCNLS